ncbi:MAG: F0F1 ATP synthase subunit epsilon [Syntrophorhabdales bacterium]|jgi:F-type H+-transporting ATPase subunit epsilon
MEKLRLEIITPERVMVSQDANLVEAPGALGEFGVLPGHVTFLSTLNHGEVRYTFEGRTRFIATSGGFAEVRDDRVLLLLDTAEFGEEIDLVRAQRAKERAETALRELSPEEEEYEVLQAALFRAVTRISTASKTAQ